MKTLKIHNAEVEEILKKFQAIQKKPSLYVDRTVSNTMRKCQYRHFRKELGIDKLKSVVEINETEMSVLVEPGCPMDELAAFCAKFNLMVPVMPEFKGITVGGAINGAAIESSSFQYGQFNDICLSVQVLLGNGKLITVNPEIHSDLFYGLTGAYGSLGIITLVKLKLIQKKPFVRLSYHKFQEISDAFLFLKQSCNNINPADFIEGIIYDPQHTVIILGRLESTNENHLPFLKLTKLKPFFFQHVEETIHKQEIMTTEDYLFRHDRGAFWMGAYGANLELLSRYYFEGRFGFKLFRKLNREKNFKLKKSGIFFRYLMGWWMTSRKLYRMLHQDHEEWFKNNFIIQDYYIKEENALSFIHNSIKETGIFPIWLCPVLGTVKPQVFSPHYQPKEKEKRELFIDIGIYGLPNNNREMSNLNRLLDQSAKDLGGRKMLYSFNYYSEDEFFKIYSKEAYLTLREKYHADSLVHLFDKL